MADIMHRGKWREMRSVGRENALKVKVAKVK